MKLIVTEQNVGELVANYIKTRIKSFNPTAQKPFVIALPTGGTSIDMYKHIVALHKAGELSFKNVVSFNLDEYINLDQNHPESYHSFMKRNLFDHVDFAPENINIPDGNAKDIGAFCKEYEAKIKALGGIELFLGGVGTNGHIAFNEPGSAFDSRTRQVALAEKTIKDNARFFGGDIGSVPKTAVTMGIGTILESREIIIMATGAGKSQAVYKAVEGKRDEMWTITALQNHDNAFLVTDKAAAAEVSSGALEESSICNFL